MGGYQKAADRLWLRCAFLIRFSIRWNFISLSHASFLVSFACSWKLVIPHCTAISHRCPWRIRRNCSEHIVDIFRIWFPIVDVSSIYSLEDLTTRSAGHAWLSRCGKLSILMQTRIGIWKKKIYSPSLLEHINFLCSQTFYWNKPLTQLPFWTYYTKNWVTKMRQFEFSAMNTYDLNKNKTDNKRRRKKVCMTMIIEYTCLVRDLKSSNG